MHALLRIFVFCFTLVALMFQSAGRSRAQTPLYTLTDLGFSEATSINNQGQISGIQNPGEQAVLWENGVATPLGSYFTRPTRINELGHVVGYRTGDNTGNVPLLWRDGQEIELGLRGILPYDINNRDQIVGRMVGLLNGAFLYQNDQMTQLTNLLPPNSGWQLTSADAINDTGLIAGLGRFNTQRRFFLFDTNTNTITDIGAPIQTASFIQRLTEDGRTYFTTVRNNAYVTFVYDGSGLTELPSLPTYPGFLGWDMNEAGDIAGFVGRSQTGHAALWKDGTLIDLNDVLLNGDGWTLAEAIGINDVGQIVGYGFSQNQNEFRAFLLTPVSVPEPDTLLLLLSGFTGALLWRWRRQ